MLGLSYVEAAEVCACAVGTIRSRVSRAREDLANALTGRGTNTTASHG
jgi:RNA polymerase sigma-70 factor (ECF subfamily)